MAKRRAARDITVENHGSIVLLRCHTGRAISWLQERAADAQWLGNAMACEPRYVDDIVDDMSGNGFVIV